MGNQNKPLAATESWPSRVKNSKGFMFLLEDPELLKVTLALIEEEKQVEKARKAYNRVHGIHQGNSRVYWAKIREHIEAKGIEIGEQNYVDNWEFNIGWNPKALEETNNRDIVINLTTPMPNEGRF